MEDDSQTLPQRKKQDHSVLVSVELPDRQEEGRTKDEEIEDFRLICEVSARL